MDKPANSSQYTYNDYIFEEWGGLSVEYYLLGRAGFFVTYGNHVLGYSLHHAAEMVLKAGIVRKRTTGLQDKFVLGELKDKFGHNLEKLWPELKRLFATAQLARFDRFIAQLNQWENMRYPEGEPLGMDITFGNGGNTFDDESKIAKHITHVLDMTCYDEFIHLMWKMIGYDPLPSLERVFLFRPLSRQVYEVQNKYALKVEVKKFDTVQTG